MYSIILKLAQKVKTVTLNLKNSVVGYGESLFCDPLRVLRLKRGIVAFEVCSYAGLSEFL